MNTDKIKSNIKRLGHKFGVEISSYPNQALKSRKSFMKFGNFDLVLDVGANIGQFAKELREIGYANQIISFEPLNDAFKKLQNVSNNDSKWQIYNYALGDKTETVEINVSKHSASSSFFQFEENYIKENENLKVIAAQAVEVKKLEIIFEELGCKNKKSILLKMDTQGFEKNVLQGSVGIIDKIAAIQLETSLTEIYKGETLFIEMLNYLENMGFKIFTLEPYYFDAQSNALLQVEVYLLKDKNYKSYSA